MKKDKIKKVLFDIFIKYQLLVVILIALDQFSKILALKYLKEPVVIFSWLQLKLQINSGVAFSLFKDAPQYFSALVSIVAAGALEYYIIAKKPKEKVFNVMLLFLVAGAVGNGIDRWLSVFGLFGYKGVVDFIFPTFFANFNVADIYVTLTCFAILLYFVFATDDGEPTLKELRQAKKKLADGENEDTTETNENESSEEALNE